MSASKYNPEIHHQTLPRLRPTGRRSIRLKGHDYAGGGLYFVTICAHREFIEWAKGNPFGVGAGRIAPASGATCVSQEIERATCVSQEIERATCVSQEIERATCVSQEIERATCVSPVREIIAEEWAHSGQLRDDVSPGEFVVMPDHCHGLIRIEKGQSELGHVIGAVKAAASRRMRRGDTHVAHTHVAHTHVAHTHVAPFTPPPKPIRIWHRNYYEMIVRTPEAAANIAEYIRMNPWKLVQHATHNGQSFRMIGNPALLQREKTAMLCSRNCPPDLLAAAEQRARNAGPDCCFLSGFHSPPEKAILAALLRTGDTHVAPDAPKLICCPAWGIDEMHIPADWLPALEANRMLILEMRERTGNLAAAEARNRFVINNGTDLWIPHVSRGGMLDRLIKEATPLRTTGGEAQMIRTET